MESSGRVCKDQYYLNIAIAVSKRSTCLRRHYGCVIVKDDMIIATGYNGSPRGFKNCCDNGLCHRENAPRYEGYNDCPAVHAEQNALISANGHELRGATLYLACEEYTEEGKSNVSGCWKEDPSPKPCNICLNMIQNAGIRKVITRGAFGLWD